MTTKSLELAKCMLSYVRQVLKILGVQRNKCLVRVHSSPQLPAPQVWHDASAKHPRGHAATRQRFGSRRTLWFIFDTTEPLRTIRSPHTRRGHSCGDVRVRRDTNVHVPLLLPLPLGGGSSRLLLGPPLPRLVRVDLLLPALLAAERGVPPASTKHAH
jgi:hypothetical protein